MKKKNLAIFMAALIAPGGFIILGAMGLYKIYKIRKGNRNGQNVIDPKTTK